LLLCCLVIASPGIASENGWTSLFDGKDLSGWEVVSGDREAWQAKGGVIGCGREGGGWLKSNEQYEDFVLSLEYNISRGGNSGIFVRSAREENPAYTGMELQILDDHQQKPNAHSTGAIYASVAASKNMSKPAGEWNKVTIACIGRRLLDVMNGEKIIDVNLDDYTVPLGGRTPLGDRLRKGFIGLQSHSNAVWFRNITIKPLPTSEKRWDDLFNGKDLSGWTVMGNNKEAFSAKDGVLECNGKGGYWLRSEKAYENFLLNLEFKISKRGNSGIFIRSAIEGNPAFSGMEIQILDDNGRSPNTHSTGCIYAAVPPKKNMSKPAGEWNHILIGCVGRNVFMVMNGEGIVDVDLDEHDKPLEGHPPLSSRLRRGHIGLQDHGSPVSFRNIRIKELR